MSSFEPSLLSAVQIGITLVFTLTRVLVWVAVGVLGARLGPGTSRTLFMCSAVSGAVLALTTPVLTMAIQVFVMSSLPVGEMMWVLVVMNGITTVISYLPYVFLLLALVALGRGRREAAVDGAPPR